MTPAAAKKAKKGTDSFSPIRSAAIGLSLSALLSATLPLGIFGIQRSLWLDEAWVANSVLAPSLSGMFYYPDWLQSTPPLFLLLTRATIHLVGVSNTAFRLVPLALALVAIAGMVAVSSRLLSPPFAALACALLAFHPTTIEYSRTCKQYSGEVAATVAILLCTVLYLNQPTGRRFYVLTGAFVLTLPLAWSTVFLIPGVAIAVWAHGGIRRACTLVLISIGVLAILYVVFIRPNLSPELRAYWIATAQSVSPGLLAAVVFCVAAALRAVFTRSWIELAAVLPCLLLAVSGALHWYPSSPRTRLFVLPGFLLVAAMNAEDLVRPSGRRYVGAVVWLATIAVGSQSVWKQISEHQNRPQEDFARAIQILRQRVAPSDLLLVHPSVIEGFKLYTAMEGWHDHHAIYGDTGWPCCVRNKISTPGSSTVRALSEDLDRKVPRGFTGRIWLFYSARHTHWTYVGLDEGQLWRNHLWDRSCPPGPYLNFENMVITAMDCSR
jgi:hypothetical protein